MTSETSCTSASPSGARPTHGPRTARFRASPTHARPSLCRSLELRNNMKLMIEEKKASLKTMVDLGSDFYVQASV